nr:PREDICTED: uncharacterized protein LOC109031029 [Bemisia tabaci]
MLSGVKWGTHPSYSKILFNGLIYSITDFGIQFYYNKKTAERLSVIINQCVRRIFGFLRSTPTNAMYVESGIPPIAFRAGYITDKFILKNFNFNLPSKKQTMMKLEQLVADNSPVVRQNTPLLLQRLKTISHLTTQVEAANSRSYFFRSYCHNSAINLQLPIAKKEDLDTVQRFKEFIQENKSISFIYTDGSKTKDYTSAGVYSPNLNLQRSLLLNKHLTILNAEIRALFDATVFLNESRIQEAAICTDSMGAIQAISNVRKPTDNQDLLDIRNFLLLHPKIILIWTPGHENISGNEEADKLTKDLTKATDLRKEKIHYSNFLPVIHRMMMSDWQTEWTKSAQTKGARLYGIQDIVSTTPWFANIWLPKDVTNTISRIRLGHGVFPAHMKRINLKDSDLCRCGEVGTLDHILLQCQHLNNLQDFFNQHVKSNYSLPTNSALILSNTSKENYIMLSKFLRSNKIVI